MFRMVRTYKTVQFDKYQKSNHKNVKIESINAIKNVTFIYYSIIIIKIVCVSW